MKISQFLRSSRSFHEALTGRDAQHCTWLSPARGLQALSESSVAGAERPQSLPMTHGRLRVVSTGHRMNVLECLVFGERVGMNCISVLPDSADTIECVLWSLEKTRGQFPRKKPGRFKPKYHYEHDLRR